MKKVICLLFFMIVTTPLFAQADNHQTIKFERLNVNLLDRDFPVKFEFTPCKGDKDRCYNMVQYVDKKSKGRSFKSHIDVQQSTKQRIQFEISVKNEKVRFEGNGMLNTSTVTGILYTNHPGESQKQYRFSGIFTAKKSS